MKRTRRTTRRLLTIFTTGLLTLPLPSLLQIGFFEPAAAASSPHITSISPSSGPIAGGQAITINGSNFYQLTDRITDISAGMEHTCAVANGKAYCWGINTSGQLGTGNTTTSLVPVAVNTSGVLANKTVTSISASASHTCAVADGKAYCWGSNTDGKLGNGTTTPSLVPVAVSTAGVLAGKTVTSISAGAGEHTCAIADARAYCWGSNTYGKLGRGNTTSSTIPVAVSTASALGTRAVTSIDAGGTHTCAVADARAYCWGDNQAGNLGNGAAGASSIPVAVDVTGALAGKNVTDITTGQYTSCVVATGKAYCWGDGMYGHLGTGTAVLTSSPLPVLDTGVLAGKTVTEVHGESQHVCALADSASYCWGQGMVGQFGDGTYEYAMPFPVATNPIGTLTSLTVGYGHTCAVRDHTSMYCWGANYSGAVGNGTSGNEISIPTLTSRTNIPVQPTISPTVTLGGLPVTSVNFTSPTQLTAVTPAHAAGQAAVTVTNPGGEASTLPNAYTYLAPVTTPDAPTDLSATPIDTGVQLHWSAPINTGGALITDYRIEYRSSDTSTWSIFSNSPSAATTSTVTGLLSNTDYFFRVSAINSAGAGTPSTSVIGTPVYLTLSSPTSTSLHVAPTAGSRTSSISQDITASTNSPDGYTLSVSMEGTDRILANNGHTIPPTAGTVTSPATLSLNSWGFRVANVGSFGSGGATENGVESSAYLWAGMPSADSPATIKTTTGPSQNDTTTVWYGMRIDTQKPSGTYSGSIMYTAVAN